MEDYSFFRKSILRRNKARLFNKDLDLYYVIKTFNFKFSTKNKEFENKEGDLIVELVDNFDLSCLLEVYSSVEGINKSNPLTVEKIQTNVTPDTQVKDIPNIVLQILKDKYENSEIIKI